MKNDFTSTGIILQFRPFLSGKVSKNEALYPLYNYCRSTCTAAFIQLFEFSFSGIAFTKSFNRVAAFLLFSSGIFTSAFAQTFTTSLAQTTIGKNQYAEVSYEMTNTTSVENFQLPDFKDWIVVSGPMNSSYQSNINGQISQRTTLTYYLQPKRVGQLMIEGARAVLNGKTYTSNSRLVQVMDKNVGNPKPGNTGNAQQTDPFGNMLNDPFIAQPPAVQLAPRQDEFADAIVLRPGENAPEKIKNNLFIKIITSKNTCYEGEPIMATYKVYTRLDMDANVTRRPSFSGFSSYDMDEPNQPYITETINGKKYRSWAIRKVQLYPLQSGKLTLDPVEVDCSIRFVKGDMVANGTFDPYSSGSFTKTEYLLKSPAITITVLPLPVAGQPQNFSGAVGNFAISSAVSGPAPGKDDATRLNVRITGSGNFSMIHAPAVRFAAQTEAYEPTEAENLVKSIMPISGDKSFDYVFIPHIAGNYTIPAVKFSYFDVYEKIYKTISTQPIILKVANESKRRNPITGEQEQNWPILFSQIAAYVLPVLAIGLLLFLILSFMGKKKKQQADKEAQAMHHAWERLMQDAEMKKATTGQPPVQQFSTPPANEPQPVHQHDAYLPVGLVPQPDPEPPVAVTVAREIGSIVTMQAEMLIWQDDHHLFYKALKNDILQALSGITGSVASKNELLQMAHEKGIDSEVLQQLNALTDECDAALYSPISTTDSRHKMLDEAKFLLGKV